MNGRDPITTFGPTSRRFQRDIDDNNGDGVFEIEQITPAATAAINALAFDENLHQPFVDEYAIGFAKQFRGQVSLDLSFNRRYFKDGYAEIDINGMYPENPLQPFLGFERVDPNQGPIMQQTNATWSTVVVSNLEAIVAQNLSNNFQVVATLTRQWQHLDGGTRPIRHDSSSPMPFRTIAICRAICSVMATTTAWTAAARKSSFQITVGYKF